MEPPAGFNMQQHDLYVAAGFCPFVQDKVYCNGKKDHRDRPHWALHHGYENSGSVTKVALHNATIYDRPKEHIGYSKDQS